jgi:putative transcriptional regulator
MTARRRAPKQSRLMTEMLKTAKDMHASGTMDTPSYTKITMRHFDNVGAPTVAPLSGGEILALRVNSNMSQAVFAKHLNLTTGYVSRLERGSKRATGALLVLLNVIRRKGIESIL